MAANIKTVDLLPSIFRSKTNQKFLDATLDQLVSQPDLRKINAYVGRKFAPTFNSSDNYQPEPTAEREQYQLEPSVVVKDSSGKAEFFSSYQDLLQQIRYYGGITNNQSRLFETESYSFDGLVDFDKLVNFNQYFWLPEGPEPVDVFSGTLDLDRTFEVTRDPRTGVYRLSGFGQTGNPRLKLAHGGTYRFIVDQPGFPFWIQTHPGASGVKPLQTNLSSREVYGVENNGTDQGEIVFRVPPPTAQDFFMNMTVAENVDYATEIPYRDLQNQLLSDIVGKYQGIDGMINDLNTKSLVFINPDIDSIFWTAPALADQHPNADFVSSEVSGIVPPILRRSAWIIRLVDNGAGDLIVNLEPHTVVNVNEKVYVKSGKTHSEKFFYLNQDTTSLLRVPDLTAKLPTLYYQDGITNSMSGFVDVQDSIQSQIDIDLEIVGAKNYTSPNGVELSNGLKIAFDDSVTPERYRGKQYYVEGVGKSIRLVDLTDLINPADYGDSGLISPDYMTINRSSQDLNPWSRSNRWFHEDIILQTAKYRNEITLLNQQVRAQRPIVEFDPDIQLWNFGRVAKKPVNQIDFVNDNALSDIQGVRPWVSERLPNYQTGDTVWLNDTIYRSLVDITTATSTVSPDSESALEIWEPIFSYTSGDRVVFASDPDPTVLNRIYVVTNEFTGDINNPKQFVLLSLADDFEILPYHNFIVTHGTNAEKEYHFDGAQWIESQLKTTINQEPLFDIYDTQGRSLGDTTWYPDSSFAGTRIFGYVRADAGTVDPVLGFALKYRNFNQIGDIEFANYFDSDVVTFTRDSNSVAMNINSSLFHVNQGLDQYHARNIWVQNTEDTKQYQILGGVYDGINNLFEIDIVEEDTSTVPHFRVYRNSKLLSTAQYQLTQVGISNYVQITDPALATGDNITILIYNSAEISDLGYYEVPPSLNLNSENLNFDTLTLGQMRNHLATIAGNYSLITGQVPGNSNIRDLQIKQQGGSIVQHASPAIGSMLFLVDEQTNFVKALDLARHEYSKIKNRVLELSTTLPELDITDIPAMLDQILKRINQVKNRNFPWYYSDMVPYGDVKNVIEYTVINEQIRDYEITEIFDPVILGNRAVLVYVNNRQLIRDVDYEFSQDRAGITILDSHDLAADDVIRVVEYSDTDANYIPETPTKLGLYPKFSPSRFVDDTFLEPTEVIQGHDGSITPVFGDYRDELLLEFELRIYNNIKVNPGQSPMDIYSHVPGKFRNSAYSNGDFNQLLASSFLEWAGGNRVDFTTNEYFLNSNPWTWNYGRFSNVLDQEVLPGSWRAIYQYFYDTTRPHQAPWEMLGFSQEPSWWQDRYGPAPYTGGNLVLWRDLERGYIHADTNAGVDLRFARPGLTNIIPVDDQGRLRSPESFLVLNFNSSDASASYAVGQQGPVEAAWRRSSDYAFAVQRAIALGFPGFYFGSLVNVNRYRKNPDIDQFVLTDNLQRINPKYVQLHGEQVGGQTRRVAGYLNWIQDYLTSLGINPINKIRHYLDSVNVQLAYKMAGFSDKNMMQVIAEQSSPTSTNQGVIVPAENYQLVLHKNSPTRRFVYSAVIVEKSAGGYTVSGYNLDTPYFTIIPSLANNNAYSITVLDRNAVIYRDFQQVAIDIPYGFEFTNRQQLVDFLVSYERYLVSQGMTFTDFDRDLETQRDFKLSVREFLLWDQQGWKPGSVLVLSPVLNKLMLNTGTGIVDAIGNSRGASRILDANFNFIRETQFTVSRIGNQFEIVNNYSQTLGLVALDIVEYEHALIFDNVTVFNDIIYKPELGNRQFRLKLVGHKTGNWDGSLWSPGFIYNDPEIAEWVPNTDYRKGDLVTHKQLIYVALDDVTGAAEFSISQWRQIPRDEIKTGLLPNYSYNAEKFRRFFDVDNPEPMSDFAEYSTGMIGFRTRDYMTDFGINSVTQAKFYQGFIREKGTKNAIDAFTAAGFNGVTSDINLYEEWAMRVGEYGALENNKFVEFQITEAVHTGNPVTFRLTANTTSLVDNVFDVESDDLYAVSGDYRPDIFLTRNETSVYENDISTAGYVNQLHVDRTIFDLANYAELTTDLDSMTPGYTVWVAKDFDESWNVYRATESAVNVVSMTFNVDNLFTVSTNRKHGLTQGQIIVIRDFDVRVDGVYQVYNVDGIRSFTIVAYQSIDQVRDAQTITGTGILLKFVSVRIKQPTDINAILPVTEWITGDRLWVDQSRNDQWAVYEKTMNWSGNVSTNNTELSLPALDTQGQGHVGYNRNPGSVGYGSVTTLSPSGLFVAAGMPGYSEFPDGNPSTGVVEYFVANVTQGNALVVNASPLSSNASPANFGYSLSSTDSVLVVSAPGDNSQAGAVHVYEFDNNTGVFSTTPREIISDGVTDGRFGSSVAVTPDGQWLAVSAPRAGNVYVYAANTTGYFGTTVHQVISAGSVLPDWTSDTGYGELVQWSADGSHLVIAAPHANVAGVNSAGIVFVYDRDDGTDDIRLLQQITEQKPTSGAAFGTAVVISGSDSDIYVSSPGYTEPGYYRGVVYRFARAGQLYGEQSTAVFEDPSAAVITTNGNIRINGQTLAFTTGQNLASVVAVINSAEIPGISAQVTDFGTMAITSNSLAQNRLLITTDDSSSNDLLEALKLTVYENSQTIKHLTTEAVDYFGGHLAVSPTGNTLVISGTSDTTYNSMTMDIDTTVLDNRNTEFLDSVPSAGAVYVYELVGSDLTGTDRDQYVFAQRLENSNLSAADAFGSSISMNNHMLVVGAPGDDNYTGIESGSELIVGIANAGRLYMYRNPDQVASWAVIDSEKPTVDTDSITRLYLYDRVTKNILANLDYIDPVKGKVLGAAEQELDYKTDYDPAVYNAVGGLHEVTPDVAFSTDFHWGSAQVGKTWWDLSAVRYMDYEQFGISNKINNWGKQFPGSVIRVAEWVESDNPPAAYRGDGTPLYLDIDAYSTETHVDARGAIQAKYYFWVVGKTTVDIDRQWRKQSVVGLENIIQNPESQSIPYAAVVDTNTISLYNIQRYLNSDRAVLHIDYDVVRNTNIIHSEYQLVQENNLQSVIPERIVRVLLDSLCGRDTQGNHVPDVTLKVNARVGIDPGQSMFLDRQLALENWVNYVNRVMTQTPVTMDFNIDRLSESESEPKLSDYDLKVDTFQEIAYIQVRDQADNFVIPNGYVVLVSQDETLNNMWAMYEFSQSRYLENPAHAFRCFRVQNFRTTDYWQFADWYASDYDSTVRPDFVVNGITDLQQITPAPGDVVKVMNSGDGRFVVYRYSESGSELVGVQNGTVQLLPRVYKPVSDTVWDNNSAYAKGLTVNHQGSQYLALNQVPASAEFDSTAWQLVTDCQAIRAIFDTLRYDIFTESLTERFNEMVFYMINYVLTEQRSVDWLFKTSFISVLHQLRKLEQFPNYIRDDQDYYERYIDEVKPYRTSLREYLLDYQGSDEYTHDITDFDMPSKFNAITNTYRSPDGTLFTDVNTILNDDVYANWRNHYQYMVSSVTVADPGTGYTTEPTVRIVGGGGAGAEVRAVLDAASQSILKFEVIAPGSGYTSTPEVIINGNGTGARGYVRLFGQYYTDSVPTQVLTLSGNVNLDQTDLVLQPNAVVQGTITNTVTGNVITVTNSTGNFVAGDYLYSSSANLSVTVDSVQSFDDLVNRSYSKTRSVKTAIKFDRIGSQGNGQASYGSAITDWQPDTTVTSGTVVSYQGMAYRALTDVYSTTTLKLSGNISANSGDYITQHDATGNATVTDTVVISDYITMSNIAGSYQRRGGNILLNGTDTGVRPVLIDHVFDFAQYQLIPAEEFDNAHDRIQSYYVPGIGMPEKNLNKLLSGLTYPGVQVQGVPYAEHTQEYFNSNVISYQASTSSLFSSNAAVLNFSTLGLSLNAPVTIVDYDTRQTLRLTSEITAQSGYYVTQLMGNTEVANTTVITSVTDSNYVTVAQNSGLQAGLTVYINGIDTGSTVITVLPEVRNAMIVNITDTRLTLQGGTGLEDDLNFGSNIGINYYDFSSPMWLDTNIQSSYLDNALGTRPEDIDVDGGAYYDVYSSHSPEELVPGRLYDHLNIRVTTLLQNNTASATYRIVHDMNSDPAATNPEKWPRYYREDTNRVTTLAAALLITDTEIQVTDASRLLTPNPDLQRPGVVFVNGEKITYYTKDESTNTLGQIRRAVEGTGAPAVHAAGSTVTEVNLIQELPGQSVSQSDLETWVNLPNVYQSDLRSIAHLNSWYNYSDTAPLSQVITTVAGSTVQDNFGNTVITSVPPGGAFFDGTGLEGSETIHARFIRGEI